MPSTLRSSSISGQCSPKGDSSKFALRRRGVEQARIPPERRDYLLPIRQSDDQLGIGARGVDRLHRLKLIVRNAHATSPESILMTSNLPLQRTQLMLRHPTDGGNGAVA
jgi:hypothetical protein